MRSPFEEVRHERKKGREKQTSHKEFDSGKNRTECPSEKFCYNSPVNLDSQRGKEVRRVFGLKRHQVQKEVNLGWEEGINPTLIVTPLAKLFHFVGWQRENRRNNKKTYFRETKKRKIEENKVSSNLATPKNKKEPVKCPFIFIFLFGPGTHLQ